MDPESLHGISPALIPLAVAILLDEIRNEERRLAWEEMLDRNTKLMGGVFKGNPEKN